MHPLASSSSFWRISLASAGDAARHSTATHTSQPVDGLNWESHWIVCPVLSVKVLQAIRANRMDTMGLRGEQSDYNQLSKVLSSACPSLHELPGQAEPIQSSLLPHSCGPLKDAMLCLIAWAGPGGGELGEAVLRWQPRLACA